MHPSPCMAHPSPGSWHIPAWACLTNKHKVRPEHRPPRHLHPSDATVTIPCCCLSPWPDPVWECGNMGWEHLCSIWHHWSPWAHPVAQLQCHGATMSCERFTLFHWHKQTPGKPGWRRQEVLPNRQNQQSHDAGSTVCSPLSFLSLPATEAGSARRQLSPDPGVW